MSLHPRDREEESPRSEFYYVVLEVGWVYNDNWYEREGLTKTNRVFATWDEANEFCKEENFKFLLKRLKELNSDVIWSPSILETLKSRFGITSSSTYLSFPKNLDRDHFVNTMSEWGFCKYEILQIEAK